jgi:hypothetical protein
MKLKFEKLFEKYVTFKWNGQPKKFTFGNNFRER